MFAAIMIATPSVLNYYSGHTGRLLVATEKMKGDPFFSQSVVYVFDHSFWGAKGFIINHPLIDKSPEKFGINHDNAHVYKGGPVSFPSIKIVALERPSGASKWRTQPITVVDYKDFDKSYPSYMETHSNLHVYIGYTGWSMGQLEKEVKSGHWMVIDCDVTEIEEALNLELWQYLSENNKNNECS